METSNILNFKNDKERKQFINDVEMETIKEAIELLNPFEENTHGHKVFQSELLHLLSLVAEKQREASEKEIPITWLDPILTGENAIKVPAGCPEIEMLLKGMKIRIANTPLVTDNLNK